MTEPYPEPGMEAAQKLREAFEELQQAYSEAKDILRRTGDHEGFLVRLHAYVDCHLDDGSPGWLGGPFVREWVEEIAEVLEEHEKELALGGADSRADDANTASS